MSPAFAALPSKLVEQRPGIQSAEAQLHAASALIGVAIAAQLPLFTYWEIRDTLFTVKDAAGRAETAASSKAEAEHVNVRGAIFGV